MKGWEIAIIDGEHERDAGTVKDEKEQVPKCFLEGNAVCSQLLQPRICVTSIEQDHDSELTTGRLFEKKNVVK